MASIGLFDDVLVRMPGGMAHQRQEDDHADHHGGETHGHEADQQDRPQQHGTHVVAHRSRGSHHGGDDVAVPVHEHGHGYCGQAIHGCGQDAADEEVAHHEVDVVAGEEHVPVEVGHVGHVAAIEEREEDGRDAFPADERDGQQETEVEQGGG